MAKYVITINGRPEVWLSSKDAAIIALQAIANAVARDVILRIVEVTDSHLTSEAA